jgi:hypothetical protein
MKIGFLKACLRLAFKKPIWCFQSLRLWKHQIGFIIRIADQIPPIPFSVNNIFLLNAASP